MNLSEDCGSSDIFFLLSKRHGVDETKIRELWVTQSGMCSVTGLPMTLGTDPWYGVGCAPRLCHKEISNTNMRLVCAIVTLMRPPQMTWSQFEYMCSLMPSADDDDTM